VVGSVVDAEHAVQVVHVDLVRVDIDGDGDVG
jgi:hypothetical protein